MTGRASRLVLTFAVLTVLAPNAWAQSTPTLYFTTGVRAVTTPVQFPALNPVDLELSFLTASVEERSNYPDLIIKDFRYPPNYFVDPKLNVPTVDVLVTAIAADGRESPTTFQVASQGGGVNGPRLDLDIWFRIGRFPFMYWFRDYLGLPVNSSARGTYRIRATYRPGPPHRPAQYSTTATVVVK
jgi:hypothetical protein